MSKCPFCTKTFTNPPRLRRHLFVHTKEKPHNCLLCPAAFGREKCLKEHVNVVHGGGSKPIRKTTFECPMCSQKCCSQSKLRVHLRKHSSQQPFCCDVPGCGFKTKYKGAVSRHALLVQSDKPRFKCPSDGCSYRANTMAHVRRHFKVHSNVKAFACAVPGCNYASRQKGGLRIHTITVHSNEKPFKCSTCDFRAKSNSNLRRHQFKHIKTKRFKCQAPSCGFGSHQRFILERHFDSKHRNKDVICSEPACNLKFGSIALLKLHLQKHRKPVLKCPGESCNFSIKTKQGLLVHISRLHKDLPSSAREPSPGIHETPGVVNILRCSFPNCAYQTEFPHHYDRHAITHKKREKRQQVCSLCSARFNDPKNLRRHIQRHVGEKPYSCSYCTYTTWDSFGLRDHARHIHHIRVVSRRKEDVVRNCGTCGKNCFSYSEIVLHSMTHLKPVVVLERLHVQFV